MQIDLNWLPTIIATLITVGGGIYTARQARKARASELEAARLRELEQRLATQKMEIYEEILIAIGDSLAPEEARKSISPTSNRKKQPEGDPLTRAILNFMNKVVIYGSDDVVRTFMRFRSATGTNPPSAILMRLAADFMVAVRRDLDGGKSNVTGVELLGMRINDLHMNAEMKANLTDPFEDVCKRAGWQPPW